MACMNLRMADKESIYPFFHSETDTASPLVLAPDPLVQYSAAERMLLRHWTGA